ncbi:MAG: DUF11 domain-containing protein, partial [Gallionella sp.]
MLTSFFCLLSAVAWSATPPTTLISNTATASYSIGATPLTGTSTASVSTANCIAIGVKVELLQYKSAPPSPLTDVSVQPGNYSTTGLVGGPYAALANPILLPASTLLPADLNLVPLKDVSGNTISAYARNEVAFVRVTSFDANINPALAETVLVTLTTSGGDSELVQLTETGVSTGIFVGAVPSASGAAPVANDGSITVAAPHETITAVYNHSDCAAGTFTATSSALIDPYGFMFDSVTGAPVNGATVSLVDTFNIPVVVKCDDGVTSLLQPVISGSPTACDTTMVAGGFRFPKVAAGSYQFVITPPTGNAFPSAVPAASLPASIGTPAAPPVISGNPTPTPGGSYGGVFTLWGSALKIDIPVDSGFTNMTIQKTAGKAVVGTGEFVPYTLSITNNSASPLAGAQVADHVPPGFRYQKGSARMDGVAMPDPLVSADARTLTFSLDIPASGTVNVRYVLEVTPAAHTGTAENTAAATGGLTSNTAHASVVVTEDLYRNKSFLIGRVIDGSCDDKVDNDAKGLVNARIVLEDGTYILSDQEGRWHIDNLRPGTHVVQLDLDSLPKDYEVVACEENSRFAGRAFSQFVNLQGGTLWRADFHVQKRAPDTVRIAQTLAVQPANDKTIVSVSLVSNAAVTGYSATVMLPEFARYVSGSAKLNGAPIADPDRVEQSLTFRSLAHPAQWQDQYSFTVEDVAPDATIKSLVRFTPPGQAAKNIPVAQITLKSLAPASAETSGEVPVTPADLRPAKTPGESTDGLQESLPY